MFVLIGARGIHVDSSCPRAGKSRHCGDGCRLTFVFLACALDGAGAVLHLQLATLFRRHFFDGLSFATFERLVVVA